MNYAHLTREDQQQIYAVKRAAHPQSEIARVLERSESKISRVRYGDNTVEQLTQKTA